MNTYLLIDTATPICSVALSHGAEILYHTSETQASGGHAARLGVLVDEALTTMRQHGLQLTAVALSAGPGSYTGLRISSALAKGLCHGYGIPLIAISTLQAMAEGYRQLHSTLGAQDRLVPMLDARRQEVYTATYDHLGQVVTAETARIVSGAELFAPEMSAGYHYHFFGDGIHKPEGISAGEYTRDESFVLSAQYMLPLVQRAYDARDFVDTAYWTPNYLKEYQVAISKNKVLG